MIAAETIERQETVLVVVAVKEFAELVAVHRVVGGVEVEHDAFRRQDVLRQKGVDEKVLHGGELRGDLLVSAAGIGPDGREFQAIERALAGQRLAGVAWVLAARPGRVRLADEHGQQRIVPQPVVIDQILVAQTQTEDALLQKIHQRVLDGLGVAVVGETSGELRDESKAVVDLPQQQAAAVGTDRSAIKPRDDIASRQAVKLKRLWVTLCDHETASSLIRKCGRLPSLTTDDAVSLLPGVRNSG